MKKIIISTVTILYGTGAFACTLCNKEVKEGIYNSTFYPNIFIMPSSFIVLGIIVAVLAVMAGRKHRISKAELSPVPLTTSSMVVGIGIGGLIDGVVFHQILQWHQMFSNIIAPANYIGKSVNMFWDGIFHAYCVLVILLGIYLFGKLLNTHRINTSRWLISGGMLCGWALFNIVEGIINHHILKLHNVLESSGNPDLINFTFLAASVVILAIGAALVNQGKKDSQKISGTYY